jgi:excisionase family DNA binding protein
MVNPFDNLLTPDQISKKLKVSIFTVYRWIKSEKLKAIKITPRVFRIEEKDFKEFMNKRKVK